MGERDVDPTVTDAELHDRYPSVAIDHDNKEQWRGFLDHRLLIDRCLDCGHWRNPPVPMCPKCWSERSRPHAVSGRGRVQWFTLVHQGAPGVDQDHPYPAVVVELEEQPNLRLTTTVVGCRPDEIVCDMAVELTWQDHHGAPIPVFRSR
jgi:uncharacterized OB-fold protein